MNTLSLSPPQQNMQRLLLVRSLFLAVVCIALAVTYNVLGLQLPYSLLLLTLGGLTLINLVTWVRLKKFPRASEWEFFGQLLIDIVAISLLLFLCGGADNPFVSYYLVPLCLSAATLRWRFTLPLTLIALGLYTLLFYFNIPLNDLAPINAAPVDAAPMTDAHAHHNSHTTAASGVSLHTLGMWFNFLLSSLLITYFVVKMASALREQDAQIARLREDNMHDEQLMAVATLAAGTAHELGTPLTTIKTLIGEMQFDYPDNAQLQTDLTLLKTQIDHCANTLQQLHQRAETQKPQPAVDIRSYCQQLIDNWLLLRPDVTARITLAATAPAIKAQFDPTIEQSIANLLNNAADACRENIAVNINWSRQNLTLLIDDCGPGIPAELSDRLGQPFASSKGKGRGLGLFLTHSTINRYGGEVKLYNRAQGGTRTELQLPLKAVEDM